MSRNADEISRLLRELHKLRDSLPKDVRDKCDEAALALLREAESELEKYAGADNLAGSRKALQRQGVTNGHGDLELT